VQRTGVVGEGGAGIPAFQVPGNNDIRVPFGAGATGTPTTLVRLQGNISRDLAVGSAVPNPPTIQIFDTQSGARTLATVITKTGTNTYSLTATVDGVPATVPPTPITFDGNGLLVSPGTLTVSFPGANGANAQTLTLNLGTPGQATGLSQFGGASTAAAITQDGVGSGSLTEVSIDDSGNVQGTFTNGRTIPLAQLALATFNNEGGLLREGSNYFTTGPGSGEPLIGPAGSGGRGLVQGAALEGSNVDIAIEFSRLILAQRGFQVNTRTISAANETLQELANIIR
jgi:flagellar hook protein FlgE